MTRAQVDDHATQYLLGEDNVPIARDNSEYVAWRDHKIKFCAEYVSGKDVLDVGCVQHNPKNYRSRYWLHKALTAVAKSVEGIDLYEPGVKYLRDLGYNIRVANAEDFCLGVTFDVVVAGDIIEHLSNVGRFLLCCRQHLRPGGVLLVSTPNPWYWRNIAKVVLKGRAIPNPEHTLWMCPDTLRQIALRYGYSVRHVVYGSRYLRDRILPLPKGIKHTSFHAVLEPQVLP